MGNKRSGIAIKKCPACGRPMEFGERVKVSMAWERNGSYRDVVSVGGFVCRPCAERIADLTAIGMPVGWSE